MPDLESAVAFYGTAVPGSPSSIGGPNGVIFVQISPDPNDPEVQAISAFLRVLNALENIRSSISLVGRAEAMSASDDEHEPRRPGARRNQGRVSPSSAPALWPKRMSRAFDRREYI